MKKLLLFLFLISPFISNGNINDVQSSFQNANSLYQQARYDSSIVIYNSIIDQGMVSAELYFNLGNAHYKLQQFPQAILNYERAKKLSPSDEDIRHNLSLANSNTIDNIDPIPMVFYEQWWHDLIQRTTVSAKSKLAIILFWIALFFWIAYLFLRQYAIRKTSLFIFLIRLFLVFSFL
ncbi:MAG: tetratricopeptide repeat protein [Bacteroidia bacterium]|nr:tetratricopeptide repeat protein [Bacteroidia bacterium]